jgi:hypothetical protein
MTVVEALGWRDIITEMESEDEEVVKAVLSGLARRRR